MSNIWIVTTKHGEVGALLDAVTDPSTAHVLAIGPESLAEESACGTAGVKWIDPGTASAESFAQAAADVLLAQEGLVAVGHATPAVRAAMGLVSARLGACTVSDVVKVDATGETVRVDRSAVDGKVIESLAMPSPACLLASTVTFQPIGTDGSAAKSAIERVAVSPSAAAEIVDASPIPPSGLETADYVVGVGRGVNTPEKFSVARRLAEAMGAELSGTMPGVRDFGNFDEDADYVGLSGVRLNSKVYVALGISGSTPHLVGFANCERTVCINKDENAQMFDYADYGIVADFEEIVPELVKVLS